MKKFIFLFALALSVFSCQKTNQSEETPDAVQVQNNSGSTDRSCTLQVTPLFGTGNDWRAIIQANGVNVAYICGMGYTGGGGYTKVDWYTTFSVPGGDAYKEYKIIQYTRNVTFNIRSDAGCFELPCNAATTNPFLGGCSTSSCYMTIKINSSTNLSNWMAEVRRVKDDCTEELVTTIGGATSGADLYFPIGGPNLLAVDGFKQIRIKQLVGTVNYTLGAPSAGFAPLLPSATFTVIPGSTASRRLGCSL